MFFFKLASINFQSGYHLGGEVMPEYKVFWSFEEISGAPILSISSWSWVWKNSHTISDRGVITPTAFRVVGNYQ